MIRYVFVLSISLIIATASANSLTKTNIKFEGMPGVVEFDCFPDPDHEARYFEPLNRRMRIPRNFEVVQSDPSWMNWNVLIVGNDNESFVLPFASIQIGEVDIDVGWILEEFEIVSRSSVNGFGVNIYMREPKPGEAWKEYWLFMFSGEKFLKVIASRPIDWNSLLTCFE